jgi:hypothetical protein
MAHSSFLLLLLLFFYFFRVYSAVAALTECGLCADGTMPFVVSSRDQLQQLSNLITYNFEHVAKDRNEIDRSALSNQTAEIWRKLRVCLVGENVWIRLL